MCVSSMWFYPGCLILCSLSQGKAHKICEKGPYVCVIHIWPDSVHTEVSGSTFINFSGRWFRPIEKSLYNKGELVREDHFNIMYSSVNIQLISKNIIKHLKKLIIETCTEFLLHLSHGHYNYTS